MNTNSSNNIIVVLVGMEVTKAGMYTKWNLASTALEACLFALPIPP